MVDHCVLAVVMFHPIPGRWRPACLRAATGSVDTVSPPSVYIEYCPAQTSVNPLGVYAGDQIPNGRGGPLSPARLGAAHSDLAAPFFLLLVVLAVPSRKRIQRQDIQT